MKYEIIIYWSNEDDAFVADVPELPGCMAHGPTQESALRNAQEAMELWLEAAREFGRTVPEPRGRRLIFACSGQASAGGDWLAGYSSPKTTGLYDRRNDDSPSVWVASAAPFWN